MKVRFRRESPLAGGTRAPLERHTFPLGREGSLRRTRSWAASKQTGSFPLHPSVSGFVPSLPTRRYRPHEPSMFSSPPEFRCQWLPICSVADMRVTGAPSTEPGETPASPRGTLQAGSGSRNSKRPPAMPSIPAQVSFCRVLTGRPGPLVMFSVHWVRRVPGNCKSATGVSRHSARSRMKKRWNVFCYTCQSVGRTRTESFPNYCIITPTGYGVLWFHLHGACGKLQGPCSSETCWCSESSSRAA